MTKEQLAALTVLELKALAKENGLKGYSKLRKADLIELLATEVVAVEEEYYVHGEKAKIVIEGTKRNVYLQNGVTFNYDFLVATLDKKNNLEKVVSKAEIFVHGRSREFLESFFEEYETKNIRIVKRNLVKRFEAIDQEKEELQKAQAVLNSYLNNEVTMKEDFDLFDNVELGKYSIAHEFKELDILLLFPATKKFSEFRARYYKEENTINLDDVFNLKVEELGHKYDYNKPYELWYNGKEYAIQDNIVVSLI